MLTLIWILLFIWYRPQWAHGSNLDLTQLSIEDLMTIEISSVSKKNQKLARTAAAVYVITQNDIRRSGARTIQEALRMVPGLHVASLDGNNWAIGARGFGGRFANKLLVMIDGRTIYDPLFSGVFWDAQDYPLADISRIEVIRGPGATVWGANAVNGVINIITKHSVDTRNTLISAGIGSEDPIFGTVRHGWMFPNGATARLYAKYAGGDESQDLRGVDHNDDFKTFSTGLRADWTLDQNNEFKFTASAFDQRAGQTSPIPSLTAPPTFSTLNTDDVTHQGVNTLARWTYKLSEENELVFQFYYDHNERHEPTAALKRDIFDAELRHRFSWGRVQEIIWGVEFQYYKDELDERAIRGIFPNGTQHRKVFSGFVQDEIKLMDDLVMLTLGSKFEYNDATGFEIQPSGRLLWTPQPNHSVWGAVSRAVRRPSRFEDNVNVIIDVLPPFPPVIPVRVPILIQGNPALESETVIATELGYRCQVTGELSLDISTYINFYDNLVTMEPLDRLGTRLEFGNKGQGRAHGVEITADWQLLPWWRLKPSYTYMNMDLSLDTDSNGSTRARENRFPKHSAYLRSEMNLPHNFELDLQMRFVDEIAGVDQYWAMDARLGWRPMQNLEIAIVGQNLFDPVHPEYIETEYFTESVQVERAVYFMATWQF